ncbi:hypothetical protein [Portibacter marinus]|uniref:hypothetical protein n=1 Tax=Portibacter marinus TaxID=2898660 RepID=UPI001F343CF0|nr:hypothetical protein [Portibacter marinus]
MNNSSSIILIFICIAFLNACNTQKEKNKAIDKQIKEETFLGQKPQGLTPELFAPGIVSTDNLEIAGTYDPTSNEFYFLRQVKGQPPKTYVIQNKTGQWQEPIIEGRMDGFISKDGKTLYEANIFRTRTDSGWSDEKSLGTDYENLPIMRLTVSNEGKYVFDERDIIGTIRYSKVIDGQREAPKAFGQNINTGKWTAHPFIAADESYLIWDSEREGGFGETDLYISFRQKDGSWGPAINMGKDINTPFEDSGGRVIGDGKYFFYNTIHLGQSFEESDANIYWVDARFIESPRKKE